MSALIERLERELAEEEAKITAAVAARAIGDGSGYWKKAFALRRKLAMARAVEAAMTEQSGGGRAVTACPVDESCQACG